MTTDERFEMWWKNNRPIYINVIGRGEAKEIHYNES